MEDVSQGAWGSSARGGCQSAMAAAALVARTPLLVHRERLVEGNNGVGHDNNGNNDDKKASVHHHRHHQQQHCQHQQQRHQHHHHHHHHQKQQQEHPGNAYDREEAQDAEGRRDHYCCYLGDSGKSAQHAFKQGGVERALEFGEVAVAAAAATAAAVTASDLGGVRDEWLSAVDDSTAMLLDDDDEATIRLELVGASAASSSFSSPSSSLSSPSSSSSSSVGAAAATTTAGAATITATTAAIAVASSAAVAAAAAVAEASTTPDQTKDFFFLSPMTGHGGDDSAADWLTDLGVGGGGSVGGGIGFGLGSADEPSCLPSGGDEMLLPPEARPPWEKATSARARFVTCDSVLPLPKPKQQQAKKKGFAARQRLSSPKSDPANSRQGSTGRPRRGSGLPR